MATHAFRKLTLLLYKNYLVRKRQWISALLLQILIPLVLTYMMTSSLCITKYKEKIEPSHHEQQPINYFIYGASYLYVVPDNAFTEVLVQDIASCLRLNRENTFRFKSEREMIDIYKNNMSSNFQYISAIVLDQNVDYSTTQLKYKLMTQTYIPNTLYSTYPYYPRSVVGLQWCLDSSLIKVKNSNFNSDNIFLQQMPSLDNRSGNDKAEQYKYTLFALFLLYFFIQLCFETSKSSSEKYLGVNALMAMNGVPIYLNSLSWLISALIFSLIYTIPTVILLNMPVDYGFPFLHNGDSFLFWLLITLNAAHFFTFGMHFSAYFSQSKFVNIGMIIIIMISNSYVVQMENSTSLIILFLEIIFPNILLYKTCGLLAYYQTNLSGFGWKDLFSVSDPSHGFLDGTFCGIIILSILGSIVHFILANYISAIHPGKYGTKKHPLYFLSYFKKSENTDGVKMENYEDNIDDEQILESVNGNNYVPGIKVRNLKKIYNIGLLNKSTVHALKGISIDFYKGQITSLLGHNGAGKTTMISILTGMISPSDGEVFINDKNIKNNFEEIMNNVGLCPQENIVFPNLSVAEQLTFFAKLKNKNKSNSEIEKYIKSLLQILKLHEKRNVIPNKLSGGQRRRVCLGMALAGDPSIIILDEPTSGLDPEIKRDVWDMLLKIRGQKTVLISTHDMEEADVLGDRIAIVHSGKLRSYGTAMFLKKLIGRGNVELTLSTESWCRSENLINILGNQSEIINTDGNKIVMSIPNNPELPDSLDRIESNKQNLGITGMSVSLITLEQVFLKLTTDKEVDANSQEPLLGNYKKLKNFKLSLNAAKGLFYKKVTYTLKNISSVIFMIILVLLILPTIPLIVNYDFNIQSSSNNEEIKLSLNVYNNPKTYYQTDSSNQMFGTNYKKITEFYGGKAAEVSNIQDLEEALMDHLKNDYKDYSNHIIAAANFRNIKNNVTAKAMYNEEKANYALPISLNLLTNTLLRSYAGDQYSIEMSAQQFPYTYDKNNNKTELPNEEILAVKSYLLAFVFMILLYFVMPFFILHPLKENLTNIKHLQRMTGLSSVNYWGTMFLFDMIIMLIFTAIIVVGFVIIDSSNDFQLISSKEDILIMIALFLLLPCNLLPLIYSFSFWLKTANSAFKIFILIPLVLIFVELIMMIIDMSDGDGFLNAIRPCQKVIFLLIPYVSFEHSKISFFQTLMRNGECKRASLRMSAEELCGAPFCCRMQCSNGICNNPENYFEDQKGKVSLTTGITYLCLTPIVYIALLFILEYKVIPIILAKIRAEQPVNNSSDDEQVKKVKRDIAAEISMIQSHPTSSSSSTRNVERMENGVANHHVFLVYELRKKYGNLVAVKDVTFGVHKSECFGLLGVNGAGKSTTFRMMTGEEMPHNGKMFLNERELSPTFGNRMQMGYCPQNDALLTDLNSYDHLRLFARLRGIPERHVENEVKKWIKKLNLTACANQPSGTYSGGNKRRLNIAISMIGIPDVVLMDEPTTGVDPGARRSLWNVIQSSQRTTGQALILTSHSMEECEVLCGRLAIMVGGKFVCIGPCQQLKQQFGIGYDIQIKLHPDKAKTEIDAIKNDIEAALEGQVIDENQGCLTYHVSAMPIKWRRMHDVMSFMKNKYNCIEDFAILSSTLEQLFIFFARSANRS